MDTKILGISKITINLFFLILLISCIGANLAHAEPIKLGEDYELLENPLPPHANGDPAKIDIHEFFSLVCIHCYNFEEPLHKWVEQNKNKINFDRTQYVFEGSSLGSPILGEIYYSFKAMGIEDRMLLPTYRAIFEEKIDLTNDDMMSRWLQKNSVDVEQFNQTKKSFGVNTAMSLANRRVIEADVKSTPQIIVDGRYRIINAHSQDRILEVADALIVLAQFERKKKK